MPQPNLNLPQNIASTQTVTPPHTPVRVVTLVISSSHVNTLKHLGQTGGLLGGVVQPPTRGWGRVHVRGPPRSTTAGDGKRELMHRAPRKLDRENHVDTKSTSQQWKSGWQRPPI